MKVTFPAASSTIRPASRRTMPLSPRMCDSLPTVTQSTAAHGNTLRVFVHHNVAFDLPANGKPLHESDHYNNLFTLIPNSDLRTGDLLHWAG
jgi:hypothetical protein